MTATTLFTSYFVKKSLHFVNVVNWIAEPTAVLGTMPLKPLHRPLNPCFL